MRAEPEFDDLVRPTLEGLGYELVRVRLLGGSRPTLQIMAERRDARAMTVEDCTAISRVLSVALDVADPLAVAYDLEVSSPGIDRPLVRPADFRRFVGRAARVETRAKLAGRRRFVGKIAAASDTHLRLELGPSKRPPEHAGAVEIAFADVLKAKLELTDDLIAAAEQNRSSRG